MRERVPEYVAVIPAYNEAGTIRCGGPDTEIYRSGRGRG